MLRAPAVASALREAPAGAPALVLGSALGSAAGLLAGTGRRVRGVELLPLLVQRAERLAEHLGGTRERLAFVCGDATRAVSSGDEAALIWANDFAWPPADQEALEASAHAALHSRGCLVLYREPRLADAWTVVERLKAPVSWHPELEFCIAKRA